MRMSSSRAPAILFDELLALADSGKPLPHFDIPASIKAKTAVIRGEVVRRNIRGDLSGLRSTLKNEYVVMSANRSSGCR